MITLISFTSLILSAVHGATRFIVDNYTIPDSTFKPAATASPFPIDVCLNYLVEFDFSDGAITYYGSYACNEDGTEVTFTDYGTDATCNTIDGTNNKVFAYDSSLEAGDVGTFNCIGEDNYVQVGAYTINGLDKPEDGGIACCGNAEALKTQQDDTYLAILITTFATEICVSIEVPIHDTDPVQTTTVYTAGECDGDSSGTYTYVDAECMTPTPTGDVEGESSSDTCAKFEEAVIGTIYRMQLNCVYNGTMEVPSYDNPCVDLPTLPPTAAPTYEPTTEPTPATSAPTAAPTEEPADDEDKGYTYYLNHIALLMIGMLVFVN
eukprot:CAMPEP_0201578084 /NCGR_PEP_ID=MMETSP0190_2-20130828/24783_1 /ASSEMBLY_ACC=CAM_ASM_000263 /TAXON_ID=37353 /ORGANISM="Rosalina sp." /LENGTH=321 /DNA_ID=CAMNT_0048010861 /DNA_START=64 /DNA_END=1029 /DNA_ORIENTATION=+